MLVEKDIDVDGDKFAFSEDSIDLSEALPGGYGQVIVLVETLEQYDQDDPLFWQNRPAISWVQSTDIGLDAFSDNDELRAWATDLDGRAAGRCAGAAFGENGAASTDENGLATLAMPTEYGRWC